MLRSNLPIQGSVKSDPSKYMGYFYKMIMVSVVIFACIGLLSAIAVHQILDRKFGLPPTNLDAQTLANFFIFTFATGVAFAGAVVVIQIASKQEDLASNQRDLAKAQVELTKKTAPEYISALKAGDEAASGLLELKQKVTLLFEFYFNAHSKDASSVGKEAFQTQTIYVLSSIIELLQGAWVLELPAYEAESKAAERDESRSGIVLLSNKLFFEFSNLRTVLESKNHSDEDERSAAALQIYKSLMEGVETFFKKLRKIRDDFDNKVNTGDLQGFNSDEPRIAAAIHGRLRKMDLKPNFNIL